MTMLGQSVEPVVSNWSLYFTALRSNMQARWGNAVSAYKTLKSVRDKLGLPFIVDAEAEEAGESAIGAWNSGLEQNTVDLQEMVKICSEALSGAVEGKRRVMHTKDGGFAIEALPGDNVLIGSDSNTGAPVLVSASGGVTHASGSIGAIPWVAVIAGGALVTAAQVYAVTKALNTLETLSEQKTLQTIAKRDGDLIKSGKATPEQVAKLTASTFQGAKEVHEAKALVKKAGAVDVEKWSKAGRTLMWMAAIGVGLYVVVQLTSGKRVLKSNPGRGDAPEWVDEAASDWQDVYWEAREKGHSNNKAIDIADEAMHTKRFV